MVSESETRLYLHNICDVKMLSIEVNTHIVANARANIEKMENMEKWEIWKSGKTWKRGKT